jgi:hypothetical protein
MSGITISRGQLGGLLHCSLDVFAFNVLTAHDGLFSASDTLMFP